MPGVADEAELLAVALAAGRAGAERVRFWYGREPEGVHAKSSPTDPVSAADVESEREIRAVLGRERPRDAILGEEGGATAATGEGGLRWIVDPLDGTVNFLYGIPDFGVSVACWD